MDLSNIDLIIVAGYLIILFLLGISFARKSMDDENYMLAGRKLTIPAFVMTLVTTWYGAILGVGEFIHGFGVVGWVVNGLVWYVVYFIFAFFLAKKIHDSKLMTVADQFRKQIGGKTAAFASVMTFIMATPAPYVLSLAVLLNALFGIGFIYSVLLGLVVSAVYIWFGGFKAVVSTDILQFIFMYLGFGMLLWFSLVEFGNYEFLIQNLPEIGRASCRERV